MILVQDRVELQAMQLTLADHNSFALVSQEQFKKELENFDNIQSIHLGGWLFAYTMRCYYKKYFYMTDDEECFFNGYLIYEDLELDIKSGEILFMDGSSEKIEFWESSGFAGNG